MLKLVIPKGSLEEQTLREGKNAAIFGARLLGLSRLNDRASPSSSRTNSSVRATVISMSSQVDAVGRNHLADPALAVRIELRGVSGAGGAPDTTIPAANARIAPSVKPRKTQCSSCAVPSPFRTMPAKKSISTSPG